MFGNGENGNGNGSGNDMETTIYLGRKASVKGDLHFEGSGRIDGTVNGKVTVKGTLTLGPEGQISSLLEGDRLVIGGKVDGRIVARDRVELLSTAVVNGEIVAPSITMEEGAIFNGNAKMPLGSEASEKTFKKEETAATPA